MKSFLRSSTNPTSTDSRKIAVSKCAQVLVSCLPRKSVSQLADRLDMTLTVLTGPKNSNEQYLG